MIVRTPEIPMLPSVFLAHGSPMNALADNRYTRTWRAFGERVRPRAVLAVSAHWVTRGTAVTAMEHPRTIHDFGGFPRELFEVEYPAPGEPRLAQRVRELLSPTQVTLDQDQWGLDHGAWSVLRHVYPDADIPVVQLSLDGALSAREHYELAQRLRPLRDEGVLVAGFGNVVHNLRRLDWNENAPPAPWAEHFNRRVDDALRSHDHAALIEPVDDEATRLSAPTPEHYWPLLYALAQQDDDEPAEILVDGIEHASIGMLSVVFGALN
ncbi:MAG TPA: 4,5-DOPA dioxygenase extradiol [Rhodanobacteraceae bacterium]